MPVWRCGNRLIPARTVNCLSEPCVDDVLRTTRSSVRPFLRRSAAESATWRRLVYRDLFKSKRQSIRQPKLIAKNCSAVDSLLWRSIDELMGRGCVPLSVVVGDGKIQRFFDWQGTDGAVPSSTTNLQTVLNYTCTYFLGCLCETYRVIKVNWLRSPPSDRIEFTHHVLHPIYSSW